MNKPTATIKQRLRIALDVNNITAQELSDKTGISKSSISQYLSGYAKPKGDRIYLISKALNISETWLLGYDVPMRKSDFIFSSSDESTNSVIIEDFVGSRHLTTKRLEAYVPIFRDLLAHGSVIIDVFDSKDRDKLIDYAEELKRKQRNEHFKDVIEAKAFLEGRQTLAALQLDSLEDSDYIAMANMIYKNDTKGD